MSTTIRRVALIFLALAATPLLAASLGSIPLNVDDVTLDLLAVERRGNVLTVKWSVKNTGTKTATVQFALTGNNVTTYAVDEENGTKYYALTDKEGHVLATEHEWTGSSYGISDYVKAGETTRYWMKLPAPPPEVKSINLIFTSAADPFESVPIANK